MRHGRVGSVAGLIGVTLILMGCGGHGSRPGPTTTTQEACSTPGSVGCGPTTSAPKPSTTTATSKGSIPGCVTDCGAATSEDGMVYRVVDARRFFSTQTEESIVAIGFTITNRSSQPHQYDVSNGFGAVTSDSQTVQSTSFRGEDSGDPSCYSDSTIDPGSTTQPITYEVSPGQTIDVPKQMCFAVATGLTVTQVTFADEDAGDNAVITLPRPV